MSIDKKDSTYKEYPKIMSIFKRDEITHNFIDGDFSLPEFEYLKDNLWVWTEKIDGRNIRVDWNRETVRFGGKTDNAQIPSFLYNKLQEMFTIENFKRLYPDAPLCLYGEGYGAKIQGGGKYIPDGVGFILIDVLIDGWWLKREGIEDIASKLKIDVVPIVGGGTLMDAVTVIKSCRLKSKWGDFLVEGLVLKPKVELKTRAGDRVITKIKHKDYKKVDKNEH
ncbi:hypothetical protein KAW18_02800 [candidate division WOR-3 bacterium]|nr:hypothetical protein [candidate division WOR-3 bacterium]